MFSSSSPHSHTIRVFFDKPLSETGTSHNSITEGTDIPEESLAKIKEFADRIHLVFDMNPEKQKEFVASLEGVKNMVFQNPKIFRALIIRSFEKYDTALATLEGKEKTQKIKEFSVFMTDIMLQFAHMNDIPQLSLAIEDKKKALETKYSDIKETTANAIRMLQGEITAA